MSETQNSSGEQLYTDSTGTTCNLRGMIRREPEWVVSRFEHMANTIADLERTQPCGHPAACIESSDEGTSFCRWCAELSAPLLCDACDSELQRESCGRVRPCDKCMADLERTADMQGAQLDAAKRHIADLEHKLEDAEGREREAVKVANRLTVERNAERQARQQAEAERDEAVRGRANAVDAHDMVQRHNRRLISAALPALAVASEYAGASAPKRRAEALKLKICNDLKAALDDAVHDDGRCHALVQRAQHAEAREAGLREVLEQVEYFGVACPHDPGDDEAVDRLRNRIITALSTSPPPILAELQRLRAVEDAAKDAAESLREQSPDNGELHALDTALTAWQDAKGGADTSPTWPHVLAFAHRMEAKLEANRHKGDREGWLASTVNSLLNHARIEMSELDEAVMEGDSADDVWAEAADVANMVMMIADAYEHNAKGGE